MSGAASRIVTVSGLALIGFLSVAIGAWGVAALLISGSLDERLRYALAAAFAVASLATLIALGLRRWRWRALAAYLVLFAVLLVWWRGIEPSNERDWQTDVALLPYATIDGDVVTVHNIRNFDYRSETDYTPAYYDKRFDLRQARRRRSGGRLLDGAGHRAHLRELRLCRRRPSGHFHRDAQGEGRGLFHRQGLLPPVRALLRGGRRTRRDPAAHQLSPRSARGCLCLPGARARSRTAGACSSST